MKRSLLFATLFCLSVVAFSGCGRKAESAAIAESVVEIGPKYSPKNGLLLPPETRESLGVKVVEVTEQEVPATLELQLRVYRAGKESVLASGSVMPEEAKDLKIGLVVNAHVEGTNFVGRVKQVNSAFEQATGMAEVLVEFSSASDAPRIGAFLAASVSLASDATVVTIPKTALLEASDGHSVYTVSGGHFVRAPVKVGASSGEFVEIKDGLFSGDEVVSEPVMSLWMIELAAVKGGQACCVVPGKGK